MKLKIAVVQFETKMFEPDENLKRAKDFIAKASGKADIIVFPEDFITGPVMMKKEFVDFNSRFVNYFQDLAKKFNIDIVSGTWIEGDKTGWYNTSHYIDSQGKVRGKYRKVNLWYPERSYINPGNHICVFNTRFGKIGLIICWDLNFPEIFRRMLKKNVSLVFCPSYWTFEDGSKERFRHDSNSEVNFVNSLCTARAFENNIVLIYSNVAGKFKYGKLDKNLIGRSQICVPFKGPIRRLDHNREEMFIQEIDLDILKDAEKVYKIREDLKRRIL